MAINWTRPTRPDFWPPRFWLGNHVPFRDGTRVIITLPDGTDEGFTFRPYQESGNGFGLLFGSEPYTPYFEPDPGVNNFLALKNDILLTKQLDEYLVSGGADFAFNPSIGFTKNDFVLYTKVGVQYGIDPSGSGRTWIEDAKGNKVEYIPQGNKTLIRHSNSNVQGGLTRTVEVLRDANGRISQIVDPVGNTVDYTYAGGELVSVSNRLNETTSYEYANASDPWFDAAIHSHYLKTIVDPLGRRSVAAEYRGDGRLGNTKDAADSSTEFSYELDQRTQIATTAGITSVVVGDADGNVVQQHGPAGTTIRSYDSRGRIRGETTIVGDPDTAANDENDDINSEFTYTIYGLPATQTDDRGNSTSLEYDDDGNVTSVADALGNTTTNTYDDHGNLLTTKTGEVNTALEYDAWGNVTKISNNANDALGRVSYSSDRFPEATPASDVTGSHSVYDAAGRVITSTRVTGLEIVVAAVDGAIQEANRVYTAALPTVPSELTSTTNVYEKHRLAETTDQYGRKTEYTYNQFGETTQVRRQATDAEGSTVWLLSRSVYDAKGRVVFSTDEYRVGTNKDIFGSQTLYDGNGRVSQTIRRVGVVIALDAAGTTSVVNEGAVLHRATNRYDSDGRIAETVAADGQITSYEYDSLGRQVATLGHPQQASRVGLIVQGDPLVRLRSETIYGDDGRVQQQITNIRHYVSVAPAEPVIDRSAQQIASYEYDVAGNTISVTQSAAGSDLVVSTETEYDDFGRKTAEIDPVGNRTEYQYDSQGRLHKVILPAVNDPRSGGTLTNPVYEYLYDANGNQTHIIDPYGNTTVFTFDASGRQLTRTLPLGSSSFNPIANGVGIPTDDTERHPFTEYFAYDDRGRQYLQLSFEGIVTELVFDDNVGQVSNLPSGRLVAKNFYPDLATFDGGQGTPNESWLYTYDEFGREVEVTQVVSAAGSASASTRIVTTVYNAQGQKARVVSPEGVINYEYDTLGRKTRTFTGDVADPIDDWHYTYDSLSRLVSINNPTRDGQEVDIFFRKHDQLSAGDEVQSELTTYHYDLLGNLDWQLSDQLTVNTYDGPIIYHVLTDYAYDGLNRLDEVAYKLGRQEMTDLPFGSEPIAVFDYEVRADGKRESVTESYYSGPASGQTNVIDWEYDALGRLVDEVFNTNADDLLASGQLQFQDEIGSTRSLQDYADHYEFDMAGNRVKKTTDFDLSTEAVDQVFFYGFDANDRLLWEQADLDGDGPIDQHTTYGYGENNSATQQTAKTVTDPIGNRKSKIENQYDLQGRMASTVVERYGVTVTERESTSFDYDHTGIRVTAHNKLERVSSSTGLLVTFHELDTTYLVDHQNFTGYQQVLREETIDSNTGAVVREVVYTLGHDVVSQWSRGFVGTYYPEFDPENGNISIETVPSGSQLFVYDGHGSTRAILPRGRYWDVGVDKAFTYDAYGNALGFNPTFAGTSILYSGEQYDSRIGLGYNRARYVDFQTGTWKTKDPFFGYLQDPQSLHKYAYVHGDPINGADPTGKFAVAGMLAGLGVANSVRSIKTEADLAVFDSFVAMYDGVRLRKTAEQVFASYLIDQAIGFGIGLGVGAVFRFGSSVWDNGIGYGYHRNAIREFLDANIPWSLIGRADLAPPRRGPSLELESTSRQTLSQAEAAAQSAGVNAHFHDRHGAGTTIEQQHRRATEGVRPDLPNGPFDHNLRDSGRFLTEWDQLNAYNEAISRYHRMGSPPNTAFPFEMPYVIGEGFTAGGGDYVITANVVAVFNNGHMLTMYPKLSPLQ